MATTRSPLWLKRHQFESDLDEEMQLLAVCEVSSKVGEGGVMAKKAFKVVLKTENGQSEFTYAREHDPRSALGLALKRHTEPWIGKPKIWPVYDANEIDSNPDAEPLLTVAAKDVIVPVTWIGSETGKAAKGE